MSVMVHPPATVSNQEIVRLDTTQRAVDVWLDSFRSENTRDAYKRDIALWFGWCRDYGVDPGRARRGDVDGYARWLDGEYDNPATRARKLAAVSSFYTYWMYEGATDRNPVAHVRRPKVPEEPGSIALTRREMTDFLAYVNGQGLRPSIVTHLLGELGLRVSELCNARVGDLGYSSGHRTLTVTRKGDVLATSVVPPRTASLIDEYLAGRTEGPILITSTGRPLSRQYVRKLLRRLAKEAGLPAEVWQRMHPHVLRHSAATLLSEAGRPIQDIQRMLGHADPRTTQRYTHHRAGLDSSPVYDLAGMLAA